MNNPCSQCKLMYACEPSICGKFLEYQEEQQARYIEQGVPTLADMLAKVEGLNEEEATKAIVAHVKDEFAKGEPMSTSAGSVEEKPSYEGFDPKTVVGQSKPSTHCIPPIAILELGRAMADGERKYGLMNWRGSKVKASVYYDAILRHLFAWWDGEDDAQDSGCKHLAHIMGCCSILMDAHRSGTLVDDRPMKGTTPEYIMDYTN